MGAEEIRSVRPPYYSTELRNEARDDWDHTSHISEFSVSEDPDRADAESGRIVLQVDQPYGNHNAGQIGFGPDGYLYTSLGDHCRGMVRMNAPWFAEPASAIVLVALGCLYGWGTRRVKASGARIGWFRPAMFLLGWMVLALALVSPLHPAGEVLVSAHMAQHTLLVLAPLPLAVAKTGTRSMQALAPTYRSQLLRRFGGTAWIPLQWWATLTLMGGTILVWHLPGVLEFATDIPIVHAIEHLSLILVSALYWSQIVAAGRRASDAGGALASLFVLFVAGAAAGALLTFAAVPWYPDYIARAASVGVEWFDDQQMAGVIMSVPMGVVLMGVAAWLGWCWSGAVGLRQDASLDAAVE